MAYSLLWQKQGAKNSELLESNQNYVEQLAGNHLENQAPEKPEHKREITKNHPNNKRDNRASHTIRAEVLDLVKIDPKGEWHLGGGAVYDIYNGKTPSDHDVSHISTSQQWSKNDYKDKLDPQQLTKHRVIVAKLNLLQKPLEEIKKLYFQELREIKATPRIDSETKEISTQRKLLKRKVQRSVWLRNLIDPGSNSVIQTKTDAAEQSNQPIDMHNINDVEYWNSKSIIELKNTINSLVKKIWESKESLGFNALWRQLDGTKKRIDSLTKLWRKKKISAEIKRLKQAMRTEQFVAEYNSAHTDKMKCVRGAYPHAELTLDDDSKIDVKLVERWKDQQHDFAHKAIHVNLVGWDKDQQITLKNIESTSPKMLESARKSIRDNVIYVIGGAQSAFATHQPRVLRCLREIVKGWKANKETWGVLKNNLSFTYTHANKFNLSNNHKKVLNTPGLIFGLLTLIEMGILEDFLFGMGCRRQDRTILLKVASVISSKPPKKLQFKKNFNRLLLLYTAIYYPIVKNITKMLIVSFNMSGGKNADDTIKKAFLNDLFATISKAMAPHKHHLQSHPGDMLFIELTQTLRQVIQKEVGLVPKRERPEAWNFGEIMKFKVKIPKKGLDLKIDEPENIEKNKQSPLISNGLFKQEAVKENKENAVKANSEAFYPHNDS